MMDSAHTSYSSTIVPERCDCHPGDLVASRYSVEKVLGEGSFGVVYKVKDIDGSVWAMKLLRLWDVPSTIRQPLVSRFEMEYKTSCIRSRNLVHSKDYGFFKGNPFIVMEFCDGGDLAKFIGNRNAPLISIAKDVLTGLNDLHINGKVHRDLKPENVLFKSDGTAVLTDFGISGDRNKRMTEKNIFGKPTQIFGTYAYMPPEQVCPARGNSTVLPTTDIYSFGVMMYQLITGVLPFGKLEDQNDLVRYQKRGKAGDWDKQKLLDAPNGNMWFNLISQCLVPDHKLRVQSAVASMSLVPSYYEPPMFQSAKAPVQSGSHSSVSTYVPASDSPSGKNLLRIMQGKEYGKEYSLDELVKTSGRRVLTMGRERVNTIVVADFDESYVSRRHCTIEQTGDDSWQIRDGQWDMDSREWRHSMNGTYVNSDSIGATGRKLHNGDIITIGDIKLKFEL